MPLLSWCFVCADTGIQYIGAKTYPDAEDAWAYYRSLREQISEWGMGSWVRLEGCE